MDFVAFQISHLSLVIIFIYNKIIQINDIIYESLLFYIRHKEGDKNKLKHETFYEDCKNITHFQLDEKNMYKSKNTL